MREGVRGSKGVSPWVVLNFFGVNHGLSNLYSFA